MYKTAQQATEYIEQLAPKISGCQARVFLAVPFTAIISTVAAAKQTKIVIGAQNMCDAHEGAFTGEVASLMLKEAGASFVLLGHSERRRYFGETDEMVHRKVVRALQDDIQPVLCIGETFEDHEEKRTRDVLQQQIKKALTKVPKKSVSSLILAYEPIWAIGTGRIATPKIVHETHSFCRKCLEEHFGDHAEDIPILYGGSVKADLVKELVSQKDVDGVLVGGASLEPESLTAIVQQCEGVR